MKVYAIIVYGKNSYMLAQFKIYRNEYSGLLGWLNVHYPEWDHFKVVKTNCTTV